jgi:hypothetical protein
MISYRYEILAKKVAPQWVILAKKSTRQRKNGFSTLNLGPPTSRSIASFIEAHPQNEMQLDPHGLLNMPV